MMARLLVILFLTSANVYAQPPGIADSMMRMKGTWGKFAHTYPNGPRNLFPVVEKKVDSIAKMFRQAYPELRGTDGAWYASLDETPVYAGGPWAYAYRAGFKYFYYNTAYKKVMTTGETGTWAYALVNRVAWFFEAQDLSVDVDGMQRVMWKFPHEKGGWKGYTLYEPVAHDKTASAVILTKQGRIPWKPVTQLQYLQALRKKHEAEKKHALDNALNEDFRKKFRDFWDKELKIIDDYIKNNSEATLNQQAIISNWRIFRGSFPTLDSEKSAYKMVYIDHGYFNDKLPTYAPQLIVLYWRWNNNAPGLYFREQLETNFPVQKLQAMISQN